MLATAIVTDHWKTYGRNYYSRYDYEEVDSKAGDELMRRVGEAQTNAVGSTLPGTHIHTCTHTHMPHMHNCAGHSRTLINTYA